MSWIESPTCYEVPDSQPRTQEEWDFYFPPKRQVSSSSRPTSDEKPNIDKDHGIMHISDDETDEKADHSNTYMTRNIREINTSPYHTEGCINHIIQLKLMEVAAIVGQQWCT